MLRSGPRETEQVPEKRRHGSEEVPRPCEFGAAEVFGRARRRLLVLGLRFGFVVPMSDVCKAARKRRLMREKIYPEP